jgi:hypothetical protein
MWWEPNPGSFGEASDTLLSNSIIDSAGASDIFPARFGQCQCLLKRFDFGNLSIDSPLTKNYG